MRKSYLGLLVAVGLCACSSGAGNSPKSANADISGGGTGSAPPGADNSGVGAGSSGSFGGSGGVYSGGTTSGGGTGYIAGPSSGAGSSGASSSGAPTPSSGGSSGGVDAAPAPASGILTAGVWDDSLNYDFFGGYLASHTGIVGGPGFTMADYDASHAAYAQRTPHSVVDAALVIDTTGSMADELSYLTAEFANISSAIAASFHSAAQRWALIVYRDTPATDPGDAYVVKSFDFTSDMQTFASTVGAQTAANGGDYPESPELGLQQLEPLTWRTGTTVAKVAFWVADAPQHSDRGPAMNSVIAAARDAGIHIYPVSASGTDNLLELTMRSAAEITGGRYLFLTDDSGVGDPHKIPEIPCYFVTRLTKALVRAVSMELSGNYIGPDPADVIRVSGNPSTNGTCPIDDGGTVQIF
jgi:hypothetical protein